MPDRDEDQDKIQRLADLIGIPVETLLGAYERSVERERSWVVNTREANYVPWTDGYAVGYRVVFKDGSRQDQYIYLNPSSETDDGIPNVFVYIGPHGDPAMDSPAHHYDLRAH